MNWNRKRSVPRINRIEQNDDLVVRWYDEVFNGRDLATLGDTLGPELLPDRKLPLSCRR